MKHPRLSLVLGLVLMAGVASVSTFAATAGDRAAKRVLTIASASPPVNLDAARDQATWVQYRSLSNTSIIHIRPNGTYGPGLATSWRYFSTGGGPNRNFEFRLRHDARFSDGSRVTAQAVVGWLRYFAAKGTAYTRPEMGAIRSIQAVGKWTVQIHLKAPNPQVPRLLSEIGLWGAVSSPNSVAQPSRLTTGTFGAGPYKLDPSQTTTGSQYTYVPNPYFYNKKAIRWSKVVVKIISNPVSTLQAIRTGQVDLAEGALSTAATAAKSGLTVHTQPSGDAGLLFIDLNGEVAKPLADVRVRRALNYAVDRRTICRAIYGAYGRPATSGLTTNDASLPKGKKFYTYDPARAKALLADAGFGKGFQLSAFTYVPLVGTEITPAIAKYLQAVGVGMTITDDTTASKFITDQASKKFPVQTNTLAMRSMFEDYVLTWRPGGVVNPFGFSDPVLERLYKKAVSAKNPKPLLNQMTARITDRAYSLNACSQLLFAYHKKNIGGVATNNLATQPLISEVYPK